jgi:glucose-6-phosphate isomerase
LVISKSGNTAETLAQCLVSLDTVRSSLGHSNIRNNFTVIVQPGESQLRNLAQSEGFDIIDHIGELGGRFSALSAIGLTPAIARGFDAKIAVEAARNLYISSTNPETPTHNNMPLLGAAVQAQLVDKGINQSIFMPYESRLIDFTRWYQQLWAESLGKNGKGTTPVGALGPLDQHSQLQLFLDGPRDKFFTFLIGSAEGVGFRLNKSDCEKFGVNYLAGNTIGDLVNAEAIETINALVDRGLPVRVLKYRALDEDFIGELMAHFFMETLFMAKMIEVDPFGQPAIERSKILTKEYLANSSRGLK